MGVAAPVGSCQICGCKAPSPVKSLLTRSSPFLPSPSGMCYAWCSVRKKCIFFYNTWQGASSKEPLLPESIFSVGVAQMALN